MRKYSMEYRDKRYPIEPKTLRDWKLKIEHGDKTDIAKVTKISYSMIKKIFIEKKATLKQIETINNYFNEKH